MVDFAAACARGRARPSWAPRAAEADSRCPIGEDARGDPAPVWRVIRVRGAAGPASCCVRCRAMAGPAAGDPAPDFALEGTDGRFTLSEHRGERVVLLFYPGDDTPVCTRQFCSYRDRGEDF